MCGITCQNFIKLAVQALALAIQLSERPKLYAILAFLIAIGLHQFISHECLLNLRYYHLSTTSFFLLKDAWQYSSELYQIKGTRVGISPIALGKA